MMRAEQGGWAAMLFQRSVECLRAAWQPIIESRVYLTCVVAGGGKIQFREQTPCRAF